MHRRRQAIDILWLSLLLPARAAADPAVRWGLLEFEIRRWMIGMPKQT